jgi:hypothetical protein
MSNSSGADSSGPVCELERALTNVGPLGMTRLKDVGETCNADASLTNKRAHTLEYAGLFVVVQ